VIDFSSRNEIISGRIAEQQMVGKHDCMCDSIKQSSIQPPFHYTHTHLEIKDYRGVCIIPIMFPNSVAILLTLQIIFFILVVHRVPYGILVHK